MTCELIKTELDNYLDGDMAPDQRWELEAHLQYCDTCRTALERARSLERALEAYPVMGPTPGFFGRALENARRAARPALPASRAWRHAGTLAAGVAILVLGGVLLRHPALVSEDPVTGLSMAVHETRTVNLVFASTTDLEGVSLTVSLPDGVELAEHRGVDRVRWTTRLQAGKNVLPLSLIAVGGAGGEVVARLEHEGDQKTFTVSVAVIS